MRVRPCSTSRQTPEIKVIHKPNHHRGSDSSSLSFLDTVTQLVFHQPTVLLKGTEIRVTHENVDPLATMACEQKPSLSCQG